MSIGFGVSERNSIGFIKAFFKNKIKREIRFKMKSLWYSLGLKILKLGDIKFFFGFF